MTAKIGSARLLASLFPLVIAAQARGEPANLSWIDQDRIAAGEVVFQTGRIGRLIATIDVAVRIEAPAEAIWAVLTSCEVAPEYVPHVVGCELIETVDDGRSELFLQTVKPAFFLPRFDHVFRLEYEPYERIDVSRVSGPLAVMEGSWWLLDRADGAVLLVHALRLDPGLPVPRFFVRANLKRDIPKILTAVRERSEASR